MKQPVIEMLQRLFGAEISQYDESFLVKSFEKKFSGASFQNLAECENRLGQRGPEADDFLQSLRITYSEFFRSPLSFAFLEQRILPLLTERKRGRTELRVWSAACATGQEAYSIAMLLDDFSGAKPHRPCARIFATDISEPALAVARDGVYDFDAVQHVKLKYVRRYFTERGDTYTVIDKLKHCIDFSTFDLLDSDSHTPAESIFGSFDIVFCSNLLYYFKPECRRRILNKISLSLSDNGYLVTSETEKSIVDKTQQFRMVAPPMAIYQRTGGTEK